MADDFDTAVRDIADIMAATLDKDVRGSGYLLVDEWDGAAPVRSGDFRASLEGGVGEVPENDGLPPNLPHYAPPGHDMVDAVMADWSPGQPIIFADQVPYAERLANGYSPQAAAGWVDVITETVASAPGPSGD